MTRGLITIATGNEHYFELAANFLLSYRFFAENPLPVAIIADKHNEYTQLFDDVIITDEAKCSFLDKFLLLKLCPYDETIFFDADSLAYGDLNEYWDFFKDATDFSSLGGNHPKYEDGSAWYDVSGIGEYADKIQYKTRVHLGVCFIRKSEKNMKMYNDCIELYNNLDKLHFHTCPNSLDECIMGIAMPMNNMLAIPEKVHMMAAFPCLTTLKADLLNDVLTYETAWGTSTEKGILLHWGTNQTYEPLYRYNAECLKYRIKYENGKAPFWGKMMYQMKMRYYMLCFGKKIKSKCNYVAKVGCKLKHKVFG